MAQLGHYVENDTAEMMCSLLAPPELQALREVSKEWSVLGTNAVTHLRPRRFPTTSDKGCNLHARWVCRGPSIVLTVFYERDNNNNLPPCRFPQATSLDLSRVINLDESLLSLPSFGKLSSLNLQSQSLRDKALAHIVDTRSLTSLNLRGCSKVGSAMSGLRPRRKSTADWCLLSLPCTADVVWRPAPTG